MHVLQLPTQHLQYHWLARLQLTTCMHVPSCLVMLDWMVVLSLLCFRRPNQLATLRELESKVNLGRVSSSTRSSPSDSPQFEASKQLQQQAQWQQCTDATRSGLVANPLQPAASCSARIQEPNTSCTASKQTHQTSGSCQSTAAVPAHAPHGQFPAWPHTSPRCCCWCAGVVV